MGPDQKLLDVARQNEVQLEGACEGACKHLLAHQKNTLHPDSDRKREAIVSTVGLLVWIRGK